MWHTIFPMVITGTPARPGQRIIVVGTTGSGKTTLARQLAERRALPHVELDALHWNPNWTPAPTEVFRERTARALSGDSWVVDGNYHAVRDIVWQRGDTIIWLDYPLPLILWRLFKRVIWRASTRAELWNGNRETFRSQFLSRDSLFIWALKTYRRRRREYPELFARPAHAHLAIIHFRSPQATRRWLEALPAQ